MALTVEKSEGFDYPHAHTTLEDLWIVCPPPPLVAFVGTLIFNALSCCTVGFDVSRAPLDEESHRPYYSELLLFIEKEWNDKELGGHVQTRLERAINYVRYANHLYFDILLTYSFLSVSRSPLLRSNISAAAPCLGPTILSPVARSFGLVSSF